MSNPNPLKPLLRTPVRTGLFLLLLAASAALLACGGTQWALSRCALEEVEQTYLTMGTLAQLPDSTATHAAVHGDTVDYYDSPEYTVEFGADSFGGLPVKNRPVLYCQVSLQDGLPLKTPAAGTGLESIVFTVQETVNRSTVGSMQESGSFGFARIPACLLERGGKRKDEACELLLPADCFDSPSGNDTLFAGGKYCCLISAAPTADPAEPLRPVPPVRLARATEARAEYETGVRMFYEYTPGFPESAEGKKLLDYCRQSNRLGKDSLIAVPTDSLWLLPAWYDGQVLLKQGRAITEQEFASGAKVCMLPDSLLSNPERPNSLKIGGRLDFSFLARAYGVSPSSVSISESILATGYATAAGELPAVSGGYELVGTYILGESLTPPKGFASYRNPDGTVTGISGDGVVQGGMGALQAILPLRSVELSEIKLTYGGPLIPENTSFLLKNGTAAEFQAALNRLPNGRYLRPLIRDMGYSELKRGLDALSLSAAALLAAGIAASLSLLVFFLHLQIGRGQRDAALRRSLGMGKARCAAALVAPVLLVVLLGVGIGVPAGHAVSGRLAAQICAQALESGYSRAYSDQLDASSNRPYTPDSAPGPAASLLSGGCVLLTALALSALFAARSLRPEPLVLLSRREP